METFALMGHFYPGLDPADLDADQVRHYVLRIPLLLKMTLPRL